MSIVQHTCVVADGFAGFTINLASCKVTFGFTSFRRCGNCVFVHRYSLVFALMVVFRSASFEDTIREKIFTVFSLYNVVIYLVFKNELFVRNIRSSLFRKRVFFIEFLIEVNILCNFIGITTPIHAYSDKYNMHKD